ncbi:hypothetical protein SELMODRAFT_233824 [Selaginella moellendorffii]|uniref:glutathione transferase n=1 Tax=Selaginella moellendorffii TaxID=88036 RepID=D8SEW2_SELML|nr:hypothetical protein SELMODRAFT_233824 [Selaginella moellendorffii]
MELEEKRLPYKATYIQEGPDKPAWFMEKNPSGLMPVLRDGSEWIQDSERIFEHLEAKFPNPALKTPDEFKDVGSGIFPRFVEWLKSKDQAHPAKQDLIKELLSFNQHLQKHGPYIAGEKPTDSDFTVAPKLRHARVALGQIMGFAFPEKLEALHKYIELMEARPSFIHTDSPDEMIICGWRKKFSLPEKLDYE